jgi:hypothetical protein
MAALCAIDKPRVLADPGDFAGAFRVARWRVGGAIATSFKRVLTGRLSNSVFLVLGSRPVLIESWVSCSDFEVFAFPVAEIEEDIVVLPPPSSCSRFTFAEDLTAAQTEGLNSASIRLRMRV